MAISNTPPFSIKMRIFPGGDPADASTWTNRQDISQYVRYPGSDGGQAITYSFGRQDEAMRVDASQLSFTADNRDGRFVARNPYGPYYGGLRKGTPIMLNMVSGEDTFTRTGSGGLGTSSSGQVWASSSSWSINGSQAVSTLASADLVSSPFLGGADMMNGEGRVTVSVSQVATGNAWMAGAKIRNSDTTNGLILAVQFDVGGVWSLAVYRSSSTSIDLQSSTGTLGTYVANDKIRLYWQADGPVIRLKAWKPANPATPDADEPTAWSTSTSTMYAPGGKAGMLSWRRANNTNSGMSALFDDLVIEANEFTGTIAELPIDWDMTGNNAWCMIRASGPFRRLQQGSGALKSPLARQLPSYKPTGYWTLEDGPQAQTFGSSVNGVGPAFKSGSTVQPAGDSTLTGGGPAPTLLNGQASIRGYTPKKTTGTGFSAMFFCKLQTMPTVTSRIAQFNGSGRIVTWNIYIKDNGSIQIEGIENDGTVTVNSSYTFSNGTDSADPTQWVAYQLETEYNSATSTQSWALIWHQVGLSGYLAGSGSFSTSAATRVQGWQLGSGLSDISGAAFAHLYIGENTLPFVDPVFSLVSDGYRGETASLRLVRTAAEAGVPFGYEAGIGFSEAMGPQRPGTFLDVAQDCEEADYGILYEFGSGIAYRPRKARYSFTISMLLSMSSRHIGAPPRGVDDDQRLRNDWTVSRDNGSYAQVVDGDSVARYGRYDDSAQLNVQTDDVLVHHAGWRVYLGTRDDLRWPSITLNLAGTPALIPLWRGAPYGFRMKIALNRFQIPTLDPDVIAEGCAVTLWPHGWQVTANCSPAKPWDITLSDGANSRAGMVTVPSTSNPNLSVSATTLNAQASASATSLAVTTSAQPGIYGPAWSTTAVPYDIVIAGEQMTVTAVSGTGLAQTFTVTRGVNGISKTLPAGSEVQIAKILYAIY